jgi:uncharacterized protein (TIGR00725 family)
MRRFVVGVMGAGEGADEQAVALAFQLGNLIAQAGWVVLSGGRDAGVMRAVNAGAKQVPGSLTVGILPNAETSASPDLDLVIVTDLGSGRNNVNVLSSDVVVACGRGGPGTVAEVALALKAGKPVVLLGVDPAAARFFREIGGRLVSIAHTPEEALAVIQRRR